MSKSWGYHMEVSLFGESHGPAIGVVLSGLPAGVALDEAAIAAQMARRAPGGADWSTPRREADTVKILSGAYQGRTTGTPLCAVIENTNTHSRHYEGLDRLPRPGHADYTGAVKYRGYADPRGGGHFSGRLTAPLTFAGAVARLYLREKGVDIAGHVCQIGECRDIPANLAAPDMEAMHNAAAGFPALSPAARLSMAEAIRQARAEGDSLGGAVEVFATGVPAGLGDPIFSGFESHFASLCYGIPGVKAVEFGAGQSFAYLRGSQANDSFCWRQGEVATVTNHTGGVNGGITNGMPLAARITFRPTPSISREQDTVNLAGGPARLAIKGRHDPCIVPRALPVAEAALALTIMDFMLEDASDGIG